MKMTASAGTGVAAAGSESPSRAFGSLREKLGKLHLFSVDRNNRWPVQGWSSGDESRYEVDEQRVAEESGRSFTLDKETRWPLQGWCNAHKPFSSGKDTVSSRTVSTPSRWPQGW